MFTKIFAGLAAVVGVLVLIFLLAALFAYPVMLLINYVLAPSLIIAIFGTAKISFFKTMAFNLLFGMFFGRRAVSGTKE